ncbi:DUF1254 domain-containing protein [Roseomonas fluvialis]|uniref:DUF1254 domain-containing protein n=1 Tax=Roseomonas fluvialis TaxID=1750527 RepID=A0ABN6NVI8_9PROT|nr:DUF1254 domain-containing protein [Roseomonas fluvialis]BDG70449.1 hypothetical protein Rmf_03780 [Roseomonas fluvialis]
MTNPDSEHVALNRRNVFAGGGGLILASALISEAQAQRTAPAEAWRPGSSEARARAREAISAMEGWGGSLVLQAATYAAPLVAMYNLRATVAFGPDAKAPPGSIWRFEDIATPTLAAQSGYVSPNVNVIYGFGFADLGQEPYILTAPDSGGRYYMIEVCDMWTRAFAYPAGGPSGYRGGKFAFVGPGWTGTLPAGVTRVDCPTRWIEFQPRVHVKNEADLPAAQAVLRAIKLEGLAQYSGRPAPARPAYNYETPVMAPGVASSMMDFTDPMQFWSIFAAAMNENPPPQKEIDAVLPQFRYLGIEFGKPWSAAGVNPIYLAQMRRITAEIGPMVVQSMPLVGRLKNGWIIPPANTGDAGADYMSRCVVAIFGLTANTPIQAIYYPGPLDANNEPLTGARKYAMTFRGAMEFAQPVAPGFWSVTIYDAATRYSVPNAINRYALGSDNALAKNADGSFTLYLQHENPGPDKQANWLPAPAGPFYLILRNYAPVPAVAAGLQNLDTFQGPPPVVPVG